MSTDSNYGHTFRAFGITDDTFKNVRKMTDWGESTEWFVNRWMYKGDQNNSRRKGAKKAKPLLEALIKTKCQSRHRTLKPNVRIFIDATQEVSNERMAAFLNEHSVGFRPTVGQLQGWEAEGYGFNQIVDLVMRRSLGLGRSLGLNNGQWQSLLCFVDEILRGDTKWVCDEDTDDRMDVDSEEAKEEENNGNNKNNTDNKTHPSATSPNTTDHFWIQERVPRKKDENASNHWQRSRKGRIHPYFTMTAQGTFLIHGIFAASKELPVFKSSTGSQYIYDEESPWWRFDQQLIKLLFLRVHNLTALHSRIIAQHDAVQNVFRNKQIPNCKDMRLLASTEFKIACAIGEYLGMLIRVKSEATVYKLNQKLMRNAINAEDYQLGERNNLKEKYCRLPRSENQISKQEDDGTFAKSNTDYYFRTDLFKMNEQKTDEEWQEFISRLKKWNVMAYMREYIVAFWPSKESDAKRISLIKDEVVQGDLLMNEAQDCEADLSMI
eukprot:935730_1